MSPVCTAVTGSPLSLSGVDAQAVVTQEPLLSMALAGPATLICGLSLWVSLYESLPWLAPAEPRPSSPHADLQHQQSSFSGSIPGNTAAVLVTGAQAKDEAGSCCALDAGSYTYTALHTHRECNQTLAQLRRPQVLGAERERGDGCGQGGSTAPSPPQGLVAPSRLSGVSVSL